MSLPFYFIVAHAQARTLCMIKNIEVGPLSVNCYIVICDKTREGVVIDPGGDETEILAVLKQNAVTVRYILNTHGHFDHVGGNDALKKATGAPVLIHAADAPLLGKAAEHGAAFGLSVGAQGGADGPLDDGMVLKVGDISLTVLHTPGHTRGGVCFLGDGFVVTGDTLFAGSVGRTDFEGGNFGQLIRSIKSKLLPLSEATKVLPGHGPESTIGYEKRLNPFLEK